MMIVNIRKMIQTATKFIEEYALVEARLVIFQKTALKTRGCPWIIAILRLFSWEMLASGLKVNNARLSVTYNRIN